MWTSTPPGASPGGAHRPLPGWVRGKEIMDAYMKKDAAAKQTGGWWFNAFGPDAKPLGVDVVKGCYECHAEGAKGSDLVFSKFIE